MFNLWTLFVTGSLLTNSVCILNDKRLLDKYGWGMAYLQSGASAASMKYQIVNTIIICRVLRVPLIFVNCLIILVKLIVG